MVPRKLKLQPQRIDDPHDRRVADFFRLNDPELRRAVEADGDGFFVAEGALVIRQLLLSPYPVRAVLATPQGLAALEDDLAGLDVPVYSLSQALMTSVTGFHFHRGALASAGRLPHPNLATVVGGADLVLMAEGVTDNENLGALFRNAAAFGVGGVALDATCGDPLYRRSVRVSMGHVLRMPFARVADWRSALPVLRELGFDTVALTPAADAEDIGRVPPRRPRALLVGSEGFGLTAATLAAADRRVRIPIAPDVDSLNVATAAAVALHRLAPPP